MQSNSLNAILNFPKTTFKKVEKKQVKLVLTYFI